MVRPEEIRDRVKDVVLVGQGFLEVVKELHLGLALSGGVLDIWDERRHAELLLLPF